MPREIDCPKCGGLGYHVHKDKGKCKNCKDGKITVYTQAEMDKAIQGEREACRMACKIIEGMYIGYGDDSYHVAKECADTIAARPTP